MRVDPQGRTPVAQEADGTLRLVDVWAAEGRVDPRAFQATATTIITLQYQRIPVPPLRNRR